MSVTVSGYSTRRAATDFVARHGVFAIAGTGLLHLTAITVMAWTEIWPASKVAFLFTWGMSNCFWIVVFRRPAIAAAVSLVFLGLLITLSEFKHQVLWMTLNFVDVMIIDPDSIAFLFTIFPNLWLFVGGASAVAIPLLVLIWWFDPLRVRRRYALAGFAACFAGLVTFSMHVQLEPFESFAGKNYVSTFTRSGVAAITELFTNGMLEADASVADRMKLTSDTTCTPAKKPPHIIMVHDESSFDIREAPGIRTPPGYGDHFKSFDGKARKFLVEGIGGPSWYTEYNVLTGLSVRSFGRFAYFVTRIASGRVTRGLPNALRRCGYQTFSLYPSLGAFMSARSFQTTTGMQQFRDQTDMGAKGPQPDKFYFDKAMRLMESERGKGPMFMFVYLAANHLPWTYRYKPELAVDWRDLNNPPKIDEYLRRQTMSARDYAGFSAELKKKFPGESFLLVRYGDHQPEFADRILDPTLTTEEIAERMMQFDPVYYTTYYAIDAINFKPADVSSAADTLDGPYLPLVIQEAAGLPLDSSFVEQKNIFKRCGGIFYGCKGGAEARRFNRLLIDAGLINKL